VPVGLYMAYRFPIVFERPHRQDFASFHAYYFSSGGPIHAAREHLRGPDYIRAGSAGARAARGMRDPFRGLGPFELMHAYTIANAELQTEPDPLIRFDVKVQKRPVR